VNALMSFLYPTTVDFVVVVVGGGGDVATAPL
jgi:hypothetical protein